MERTDSRPNGPLSPTHALGMDVPDLDAPVIHANGDALPVQMVSDSSDDSDSEEEDSTDSTEQQKVIQISLGVPIINVFGYVR